MIPRVFQQLSALRWCVLFLFLICPVAQAAPPVTLDPMSFELTVTGFQHFYTSVEQSIQAVIRSSSLNHMSLILWKFFSALLLVDQLTRYALRGFDLVSLLTTVLMIAITRIFMLQYDALTAALWGWSEGFATGIQVAGVGISDEFFAPRYIWNLMTSISWSSKNFLLAPLQAVTGIVLSGSGALLSVLGFFSTVWALWGYSLAKMFGFMFIPTILFDRLSWLFDGWLRFFFSFLLYNVVARAAVVLVVIAMHAYFSVPLDTVSQHKGYVFVFNSFVDVLGLLTFLIIAIVSLWSTGSLVRLIVSVSQIGTVANATFFTQSIRAGVRYVDDALKSDF